MKVIVTSPSFGKFSPHHFDDLTVQGYTVVKLIPYRKEDMLREIVDADALIVGLEHIDEEILAEARQLKVIAKHGVGVDNIDLNAAKNKDIIVANAPATNNDAVADLAFGLMLSAARSIPDADHHLKQMNWRRYDGHSVWGKTLGIIGLGAIGKGVARRAGGFQMNILGYDVSESSPEEDTLGIQRVTLEEIYQRSDYISLHVPLNKFTKGMIGKKEFERMKNNAILINTARGGLIDEAALYEALTNGEIKGCGLDVFEEEPPTNVNLLQLDNIVVTPHMAAYTIEAVQMTSEMTADNVRRLLSNEMIDNIVKV